MTRKAPSYRRDVNVQQLLQIHFSFAPARILAAAVQLNVFSLIAAGHKTGAKIAQAAAANERGMRMLLEALAALKLLAKSNGAFRLTPLARRFLVRESPDYFGSMLEHDHLWEAWTPLAEVIRSGQPYRCVEQKNKAEEFFPALVRSLHVMNRQPAQRVARVLGVGVRRRGLRVLDVACGSGVWGIAIAEADRTAHVAAHDFPGVLKLTREYVQRHHVERQFEFLPGDLRDLDFGENRYDVALLGNIVHSEGEHSSRDLFHRLSRALVPGGRIVIIDMIPKDDRTGPPFPLFFALNMLVNTQQGDTYTIKQYRQWLADAGFRKITTANIGSHSPIIVGTVEKASKP